MNTPINAPPRIALWLRAALCFVVILLGGIFALPQSRTTHSVPNILAVKWLALYPAGFSRSFGWVSVTGAISGYLLFISCLIGVLASNRRRIFLPTLGVLVLISAMSTKGCQGMWGELSRISKSDKPNNSRLLTGHMLSSFTSTTLQLRPLERF